MPVPCDVSLLIPIYNEEENISILFNEIRGAMGSINSTYEIILVDDGSTDRSKNEIQKLTIERKNENDNYTIRGIFLESHLGKSAALRRGFDESHGDIILTLDGDLQDDPQEIPRFIEKIKEGYDLVSGWKLDRKDTRGKKLASQFFNLTTSLLTGIKLHDFASGFKAYRRQAIDQLPLFKGAHRFIPIFVNARGLRIAEIRYHHRPRLYGNSKFGVSRMLEGIVSLLRVLWLTRFRRHF